MLRFRRNFVLRFAGSGIVVEASRPLIVNVSCKESVANAVKKTAESDFGQAPYSCADAVR